MNKNFDWSETKVDLLFLIPNFGRSIYIRNTISNTLNTIVDHNKFLILIINDGIEENFDDLYDDYRVRYFTLPRKNNWERTDGIIRNVAIKNSQSKLFAQRDPEILYDGDFLKGCFDNQDVLYRCGGVAHQASQEDTNLYLDNKIGLNQLKQSANKSNLSNFFFAWHYGHCAPIEYFKKLNGYDEEFLYYGWCDRNMHDRLIKSGVKQYVDHSCQPIHLYHEKPQVRTDPVAIKREAYMKQLYEQKTREGKLIANENNPSWGNGAVDLIPEII